MIFTVMYIVQFLYTFLYTEGTTVLHWYHICKQAFSMGTVKPVWIDYPWYDEKCFFKTGGLCRAEFTWISMAIGIFQGWKRCFWRRRSLQRASFQMGFAIHMKSWWQASQIHVLLKCPIIIGFSIPVYLFSVTTQKFHWAHCFMESPFKLHLVSHTSRFQLPWTWSINSAIFSLTVHKCQLWQWVAYPVDIQH